MAKKDSTKPSFAEQLTARMSPYMETLVNNTIENVDARLADMFKNLEDSSVLKIKIKDLESSIESLSFSVTDTAEFIDKTLTRAQKVENKSEQNDQPKNNEDLITKAVLADSGNESAPPSEGKVSVLQKVSVLSDFMFKQFENAEYEDREEDESYEKEKEEIKQYNSAKDKENKKQFAEINRSIKSISSKTGSLLKKVLIGALLFLFRNQIFDLVQEAISHVWNSEGIKSLKDWTKTNFPDLYENLKSLKEVVINVWDSTRSILDKLDSLIISIGKLLDFFDINSQKEGLGISKVPVLGARYDALEQFRALKESDIDVPKLKYMKLESGAQSLLNIPWTVPGTNVKTHVSPSTFQNISGIRFTEQQLNDIKKEQDSLKAKFPEGRISYELDHEDPAKRREVELASILSGIDSTNFSSRVVSVEGEVLPSSVLTNGTVDKVVENDMAGLSLAEQGFIHSSSQGNEPIKIGRTQGGLVVIRSSDYHELRRYVQGNTTH